MEPVRKLDTKIHASIPPFQLAVGPHLPLSFLAAKVKKAASVTTFIPHKRTD